ncbi:HlyD family type I secretion periplasmic adaptor subunit [Maritimibacter alkaliphilus]|uniref:HlyD family type I secretion periplasmic adaptor subunit n=1 Tax=Maritimibacter alkaliphilus TaxID=404236 RepID=UPI001C93CEE8|nr:HlyD family type I secretion periplasmic adaptor subunit [Maritimibacter alkaliphilus]MBY6092923.1 HlyD family type I secretion periplasmic adaptor subunit [Maritimibacter alkaliphilus]
MIWSYKRHILLGALVLILALGGFAAWAAMTEINGAVVATGRVEVETRRQTIQHPDGGVVAEIAVRDGDLVEEGQALVTLDGADLQAQRSLLTRQLYETLARMDRLKAEVQGAAELTYGEELQQAAAEAPQVAQLLKDEEALFNARRDTRERTLSQLEERKVQSRALIGGYERQMEAREAQVALLQQELIDQNTLFDRGLTQFARVSALERESADLEGQLGQLEASVAEAKSAIAGYEIEALRLAATQREEAQNEFRTLQPQEAELRERLRVLERRLGRLVMRAPMSGIIIGLQIHTIGGVISPGSAVLSIVPQEASLVFAVRIDPSQIDRVHATQAAEIRFPSFNARTTPSFPAEVRTVAPDVVTDPNSGISYFTAELRVPEAERETLLTLGLQPGMPLEAFIQTGARSPGSILLKPVTDYMSYALREE